MKAAPFLIGLLVAVAPTIGGARPTEALSYRCDDVVVIGRLQNLSYTHEEIEDEKIGHGWMMAHLTVRKVVRRTPGKSVLRVRYFGHTYMRQDRDFMFVLRPAEEGFTIANARLMSGRPRLSPQCSARLPGSEN